MDGKIKETKQYKKIKEASCICGKSICDNAINCLSCTPKKSWITWTTEDELIKLIKESSYLAVGKKLGVSDNAVRKHLKRRNCTLP